MLWPAVVELVGAENKLLSAVLTDARPVALSEEELTVAFAATASFLKKKAEDSAHRATVTEACASSPGGALRRALRAARGLPAPAAGGRDAPRSEDEWVARFKDELDAQELVGAVETGAKAIRNEHDAPAEGPNMQQMLQQVQKMQRDMEQAQEALKHETVEASAGGGMVKVQVSGDLQVKAVTIAPEAADPEDVEMLCDLVLAAVNEALRAAQELAAERMGGATGGLDLGALGGLGLPGF